MNFHSFFTTCINISVLNLPHVMAFDYDSTNQSVSHDICDYKHGEDRSDHNLSWFGNHGASRDVSPSTAEKKSNSWTLVMWKIKISIVIILWFFFTRKNAIYDWL